MSVVSEIARIKGNIANAYSKVEEKGASLPGVQNSSNLADTIAGIPQEAGDGWRPQEDWIDIDEVLANDREEYPAKAIVLMRDAEDMTEVTDRGGSPFGNFRKCRTSDGVEYTDKVFRHFWDRGKDKECGLGYKTRYMIFYYDTTNFNWSLWRGSFKYALYAIFENTNQSSGNWGYTYPQMTYLQALKFKNCHVEKLQLPQFIEKVFVEDSVFDCVEHGFGKLSSEDINELIGLNDYSVYSSVSFQSENLVRLPVLNTVNCTSFKNCFNGDYNLQVIDGISFDGAVAESLNTNVFLSCFCLREIRSIVGSIKINLNFNDCYALDYDTLMRILNALYDYADDGNTHTITLGGVNLAKLRDEELAIGQNKGWTIN